MPCRFLRGIPGNRDSTQGHAVVATCSIFGSGHDSMRTNNSCILSPINSPHTLILLVLKQNKPKVVIIIKHKIKSNYCNLNYSTFIGFMVAFSVTPRLGESTRGNLHVPFSGFQFLEIQPRARKAFGNKNGNSTRPIETSTL